MCNGQFTVILRRHFKLPFQQIITPSLARTIFFLSARVFNVDASHLEITICPRHRDLFGLDSLFALSPMKLLLTNPRQQKGCVVCGVISRHVFT